MEDRIRRLFSQSAQVLNAMEQEGVATLAKIVRLLIDCYERRGKVIVFGNGGSAADSQHIAAELVGRFHKERRALACIALTTNTSILTALSNDYDFDCVFERQIQALGAAGDIAWGISTSGSARNVLRGLNAARQAGLCCIAFTGQKGTALRAVTDACLVVPSVETPRIQEAHITAAHIVCELVEDALVDTAF